MATSGGPNWLGLLQWSLANTDGTSPSPNLGPMAEEDKKWLEAVMKENVKVGIGTFILKALNSCIHISACT
jgi:hypothetical protein